MTDFKPISNDDIVATLEKWGHHVTFIPYHELSTIDTLDEILPCVLLYERMYRAVGHWCCLFRNKYGLNYFDPTGHVPDGLVREFIPDENDRKTMKCDVPYLNKLILDDMDNTGTKVIYNEVRLQPSGTNGCGAWVTLRLLTGNLSNDAFNSVFKKIPPDKREQIVEKIYTKL